MKGKVITALVVLLCLCPSIGACWAAELVLTVFNDGLGFVREYRTLSLGKGLQSFHITDIPARIDPTSVHLESASRSEDITVLEQNYEYDLLNNTSLLHKFVGQRISVVDDQGNVHEGILQSGLRSWFSRDWDPVQGQYVTSVKYGEDHIILADDLERGSLVTISRDKVRQVNYPEHPTGLVASPTLTWTLASKKPGDRRCKISYMTGGMSWRADYSVVLSEEENTLDLSGWATIDNQSGKTYTDASLRLMAGDVRIERPGEQAPGARMRMLKLDAAGPEGPRFEERPFFEYHLYTLERPLTIGDNQTKQIKLLSARNVGCKKAYYYDGFQVPQDRHRYFDTYAVREDRNFDTTTNKKVALVLAFQNEAENQVGRPLPRGKMRVYKRDENGDLEFVGESSIDHTPKDEEVKLTVGDAFDLAGDRVRTFFDVDHSRRTSTESFEITLSNHKQTEVMIHVMEHMYRGRAWEITKKDFKFEEIDAQTVRFDVKVPADADKKIHYTVVYHW